MDRSRIALLGAALGLLPIPAAAGAPEPKPVALVYSLTGQVQVAGRAQKRLLHLFERLPAGTALEAGPGSRLSIAFENGRRYELGERSRATLGRTGLSSHSGPVRRLSELARLPAFSPIAEEEDPGLRAGAVRIRTESIAGLYPRNGAAALAPSTVFRFEPVAGTERYRVEVRDRRGSLVFTADATVTPVTVPPGVLQPGTRYEWTVRTLERVGPIAKGEARFVTLPERTAADREVLRKAVEAAGDAGSWALLAAIDKGLGLFAEARDELKAALRIQPGQPEWAEALTDLEQRWTEFSGDPALRELERSEALCQRGTALAKAGDSEAGEAFLLQALEIQGRQSPRSSVLAKTLANLGNVMKIRGDLATAEAYLRRALALQEELNPEGLENADTLLNLGNVLSARPAAAEELYRRAKAIYEKVHPEGLGMASACKNLGNAAASRGDAETTDFYYQRALDLHEKLDPGGEGGTGVLENMGLQALGRGDLAKSEDYLRQAVRRRELQRPDGEPLAAALQNLGITLFEGGNCAAAREALRRAYTLRKKIHGGGLPVARSLYGLGNHAFQCEISKAEGYYRQALAIYEKLVPGSLLYAEPLHDLGWLFRSQGRRSAAAKVLCQAADVFEALASKPGAGDAYSPVPFTHCAAARADIGDGTEAFRVLERGRARGFLKQLTEKGLSDSAGLPDEIARQRAQLAWKMDSTQAALAQLRDTAEAPPLIDRLRDLRDQQQVLEIQIRQHSLRTASVRSPDYLDLAGTRRALDPGTVLLSYLVDEVSCYLFVVQPAEIAGPGLTVLPISASGETLQKSIGSYRNLLDNRSSDPALLKAQAAELYDLLIRPAEPQIEPAKRILISAQGPLYTLPFAALVRQGRYLAEWKPVHFVLSATVYAEIRKMRPSSSNIAEAELVAFGDPAYPALPADSETAPAALREVLASVRRGLSLTPIPATRTEVEEIAALFPRSRVYLGREATEERARSVPPQARIVHFATHGLLDERFPLHSALALSIPEQQAAGQENGLLQAREIFESVRLDADLVTLSACDTGLGRENGGEGLIGLTRAFQYAGARSVLASLWSVSDVSTPALMKSFYSHLRAGKAKDESLQEAQQAMIRSREFSHPYHWAAFQLTGDWR